MSNIQKTFMINMKKILYICIVQELSDLKIPYFYIFSDLEAVLTVVEYRRYQWD